MPPRRKPRRQARNIAQVEQQLDRYNRLLGEWVNKSLIAGRRVISYDAIAGGKRQVKLILGLSRGLHLASSLERTS